MIAGERVIGRDPSCAVELSGNDVSRRHAALRREGAGGTIIADLGSRNGVRVNGRPVASAALAPGDVVRLGGWVGVVTTKAGALSEIAPGVWGGGALATALAPLQRAAASDLPIVLEGETGTGKEMAAAPPHGGAAGAVRWSQSTAPRFPRGWRRASCSAIGGARSPARTARAPDSFGARRGERCCSTRSSDLPLPLQAKLLRVLEQREVQPLGETRPVPINVRMVVAGQHSLMESARAGRFRPDLLARLDGLTVRLPPLRERREDVVPLFSRLLADVGHGRAPAFDSEVAERLCLYDWPFNVRELVLLVRRLLTLHGSESTLTAEHLPARIGEAAAPADAAARAATPGAGAAASRRDGRGARRARRASGADRRVAHGGRQRRARGGDARDQPPAGLPPDGRASRSGDASASRCGEAR